MGITINEDDEYLSPDGVPEEVQEMLYDDIRYRDYLLRRRILEESSGDVQIPYETTFRQNLASSARVFEEDLVSFFYRHMMVSSSIIRTTTTSSTTTTTQISTTSTTQISTISKYRGLKKGSVCVNDQGKHFTKQRQTFPDSCCDGSGGANSQNQEMFTASCLKTKFNYNVTNPEDIVFAVCSFVRKTQPQPDSKTSDKYYGYVIDTGDANQLILPKKELSPFMKILGGILASFGESHHYDFRRRR